MAKYVDGFVLPIPKSKISDYKKMATIASKVWMKHGALDYQELVADDVPYGKVSSFPRAVGRKNSETVVFSWITFRSRAHRDKVNRSVMGDPKILAMMDDMESIMDPSRMIYGGFSTLVAAE